MSLFKFHEDIESCKYPIIKILICILLIMVMIYRNHFIHIDNIVIDTIVDICCVAVAGFCILCIYISLAEILQVYENKSVMSMISKSTTLDRQAYEVDEIINMAETNDIIEILIIANNEPMLIGSSSDCKQGSSRFFDKEYYIGQERYQNILEFKNALLPFSSDGKLSVVLIDGIKPM